MDLRQSHPFSFVDRRYGLPDLVAYQRDGCQLGSAIFWEWRLFLHYFYYYKYFKNILLLFCTIICTEQVSALSFALQQDRDDQLVEGGWPKYSDEARHLLPAGLRCLLSAKAPASCAHLSLAHSEQFYDDLPLDASSVREKQLCSSARSVCAGRKAMVSHVARWPHQPRASNLLAYRAR